MFNKNFGARRGGIEAKKVHHNTIGKAGLGKDYRPDEIFKAQLSEQTRQISRMAKEWEIEGRADKRYGNNKSQGTNASRKFGCFLNTK